MRLHSSRPLCIPALAAWVAVGVNGPSVAADPTGFGASDAVQLRAKAALEKDPDLKGLTLWLSVRDGVVLVNGGVSDEAAAAKIENLLSKVPGVSVVRVTTWVVPAVDPYRKLVGDKLAGPVGTLPSEKLVVPRLAVNPVLPGAAVPSAPALPDCVGPDQGPIPRSVGTVVAQRVEPAFTGGMLDPPVVSANGSARLPVGIVVPPAPSGPVTYPTIRPTRVPVAPAERSSADIALALLAVRRSDPRFAGLVTEVRAGTAIVTGTAASKADADAFAAEVAKIAGIDRVTVGSVHVR